MAEMRMNYQEMRATADGARTLAEQTRTVIKTLQESGAALADVGGSFAGSL